MQRLLLGSGGYRTDAMRAVWRDTLDAFLGDVKRFVFVPYALADYDAYVAKMIEYNFHAGREMLPLHLASDATQCIEEAEAIFVGGGNSFRLLDECQELGIMEVMRERVEVGVPYIGISAGTNLACPTIMTTNDMPIVQPDSFEALGLLPFQINPHFVSGKSFRQTQDGFEQNGGETREDRINEFLEMNSLPVLGLYEGVSLGVEGAKAWLQGAQGAKLFTQGNEPVDFESGSDVSELFLEDV